VAQLTPHPAYAGQLRCASRKLPFSDREEAFRQVLRAMPRDGGRISLESACWNSDFAIAWFRTPTAVDSDEVRWWWSAQCRRDRGPWSCEAAKERRVDVTISEGSWSKKVEATLPPDFQAYRARLIVATTATLVSKSDMPIPTCVSGDVSDWNRFRSYASAAASQEAFAEIRRTESGVEVDYLNSVWFRFDESGHAICWGELVIVD
jgi:hypothetical protein